MPKGAISESPRIAFLPAKYEVVACATSSLAEQVSDFSRRGIVVAGENVGKVRAYDIADQLIPLGLGIDVGLALDLGCGSGRDSHWLSANGWKVTAVDRHAELREYFDGSGVDFVECAIENLSFEQKFDLVLVHFTRFDGILSIVETLVRPGGFVSVQVHSNTHYRCFGSPKIACEIPESLEIIKKQEFWMNDRHVSGFVLRRTQD